MEKELRKLAKELLETKQVGLVIGYASAAIEGLATPAFISDPKDADRLIWNDHCYHNLSVYLYRSDVKAKGKVAIVAKGCDAKSVIGLLAENQIRREDIVVIGMACGGVILREASKEGKPIYPSKCLGCSVTVPTLSDHLIGSPDSVQAPMGVSLDEEVAKLDQMSVDERWAFWKSEFDRCIKCYACRQICPHCFCQSCIVEKSMPQWVSPCPSAKGNFSWNFVRAFHLVGRCVGCQECYRACPAGIRLDLINRKMALEAKAAYQFEAGADPAVKPPLTAYRQEDNQDFIR